MGGGVNGRWELVETERGPHALERLGEKEEEVGVTEGDG